MLPIIVDNPAKNDNNKAIQVCFISFTNKLYEIGSKIYKNRLNKAYFNLSNTLVPVGAFTLKLSAIVAPISE